MPLSDSITPRKLEPMSIFMRLSLVCRGILRACVYQNWSDCGRRGRSADARLVTVSADEKQLPLPGCWSRSFASKRYFRTHLAFSGSAVSKFPEEVSSVPASVKSMTGLPRARDRLFYRLLAGA
ncbi:hypothetical protein RRG08_022811 [Elysia crispata]|uniref:Uncharacterized protein n=1 Tax=Elysia crispata TaxID=231223 RepID=A0AAE0Z1T2_9GAST|nr:hypothetical protein RRG08_022811 [Elysia crispata]